MALTVYKKTSLTGGTSNDLDGIDGSTLVAGDFAWVMDSSNNLYQYEAVEDSPAGEDSPFIIIPDTNPGNWGWYLQRSPANSTLVITKASTDTLTAQEVTNSMIDNYGQGAASTLTLPTAASGMAFLFTVSTTGYAIHIKAGASDKIYLDAVALDDGDKVSLATPALGDFITFWTFKTGGSTWDWVASSGIVAWADGGA